MKNFLGMMVAICLFIGLQSQTLAVDSSVIGLSNKLVSAPTDIKPNHYAYEAAVWAMEQGIINGNGDGKFNPDDNVTEAQFAAMLQRFFDLEPVDNRFTETGHWADEAYHALAVYGAPLGGYLDQSVRNQPVKRGLAAEALVYLSHDDLDLTQSIEFLLKNKISTGQNLEQTNLPGYFGSDNELTRAQAVTFLYKMKEQQLDEINEAASGASLEDKGRSFEEVVEIDDAKVDEQLNALTEEEAKEIVGELMSGIVDTFYRLGEEHNWSFENHPDFAILRPQLLNYASKDFTDGFLKLVKDEFFCSCDMPPYPSENLNIQFTLHEVANDRFVASSVELDNMISSGSTVYYTVVKEDGKWVMDQYRWVSIEEEPVELAWEEIKDYMDQQGSHVELLKTTMYNGQKIYIYKFADQQLIMGVFADNSGHMWDVPVDLYS
ncbi:S-layer homology domain-containing protein [Ureibacillus sinduriensis]|uniref:S-layer homology domain-containing protein n=1 Tax=Ureibacillus sinduriensis TaxID=561440 RepID=UPI00068D7080|nr:S-layer homology domain-containing protein [Ureibacillus sinduriensis]